MGKFKTFIGLTIALLFMLTPLVGPVIADQSKVVLVGGGQAYKPLDDFVLESESPTVAGNSWYVDSGKTASGDGKSWDYAVITLDEAINLITESNGDVIHVAPGHTETIDAATDIVCDTAGVTIIGYGEGAERPTFSWADDSDATIPVSDTDIVFKNMIFDGSSTSSDGPDDMFNVTAAGFQLIGCKIVTGDSTEAATLVITGTADADRMKVINCEFTGSTDTGTTAAINFSAAAEDIEIAYCTFKGDYSSAAIYSAAAILDVNIHHNYIYNFNDDDHAIEISSNTSTGRIAHCMLVTDAYATALDSGGLDVFETYWANDEQDDVMATPVWTHEDGAVLWSATERAVLESEANDALVDEDLDHLVQEASGSGASAYPLNVTQYSILSYILGVDADATGFDEASDSLEALGDQVADTNLAAQATAAIEADNLDHLAKVAVDTNFATTVHLTSVLGQMADDGTAASFSAATDSLEAIRDHLDGTTVLGGINLDHLAKTGVGTAAYPAQVTAESIIAYIMAIDADITDYDEATDSLEAIGAQVASATRQSDVTTSIEADLLDHLLAAATTDTTDPVDIVATEVADDSVLAHIMTQDGDVSGFERVTDSLEALAEAYETILACAGNVFYVDGNVGTDDTVANGHGKSWATPFDTINYANAQCTSSNGDVILVAPGHVEALSTSQIDLAVGGVTIIGLGNGADRPKVTYSNNADSVDVAANNITLIGLQFVPSVDAVAIAVDIETSVTDTTITDCDFRVGEVLNTDDFVIGVDIKASCVDTKIIGNRFYTGQTDAECTDAIKMTGATKRTIITDNHFDGNYSTAAITGDTTASTEVLIARNSIVVKDGEPGIQLLTASTGIIKDNVIESTGLAADSMIVCDDCSWFNNLGVLVDGETAVPIGSEATAAVAEDNDGSLYERLEHLQALSDDILAGLRMAGHDIGNVYYVDDAIGNTAYAGTSWVTAKATIVQGYNLTVDDKGDIVFVAPDHEETLAAAQIALDEAGVMIIGLGSGEQIPMITMSDAASSIDVTATDVTIENIHFYSTTADSTIGIDVDASGFVLRGCKFTGNSAGHVIGIDLATTLSDIVIEDNYVYNTDTDETRFISAAAGAITNMVIRNNRIWGDFDDAAIYSNQVCVDLLLEGNVIRNVQAGVHAVELTAATTGLIFDNVLAGSVPGAILDPGSCLTYRNEIVESDKTDAHTRGMMKDEWFHALKEFTLDGSSPDTLFVVTGLVEVKVFGHVTTDWTAHGDTAAVGTADSTVLLLAATAGTAIDDEDVWTSATVADIAAAPSTFIINDGDIILTQSGANLVAGVTDFHCYWRPLEEGASVVPN